MLLSGVAVELPPAVEGERVDGPALLVPLLRLGQGTGAGGIVPEHPVDVGLGGRCLGMGQLRGQALAEILFAAEHFGPGAGLLQGAEVGQQRRVGFELAQRGLEDLLRLAQRPVDPLEPAQQVRLEVRASGRRGGVRRKGHHLAHLLALQRLLVLVGQRKRRLVGQVQRLLVRFGGLLQLPGLFVGQPAAAGGAERIEPALVDVLELQRQRVVDPALVQAHPGQHAAQPVLARGDLLLEHAGQLILLAGASEDPVGQPEELLARHAARRPRRPVPVAVLPVAASRVLRGVFALG